MTDDNNNFIMPGPAGDAHGIIENEGGEDNEEDEVQDEEEETLSEIVIEYYQINVLHIFYSSLCKIDFLQSWQ